MLAQAPQSPTEYTVGTSRASAVPAVLLLACELLLDCLE